VNNLAGTQRSLRSGEKISAADERDERRSETKPYRRPSAFIGG
jgi:hypothetical protein